MNEVEKRVAASEKRAGAGATGSQLRHQVRRYVLIALLPHQCLSKKDVGDFDVRVINTDHRSKSLRRSSRGSSTAPNPI